MLRIKGLARTLGFVKVTRGYLKRQGFVLALVLYIIK
jgi:hypothetical protein